MTDLPLLRHASGQAAFASRRGRIITASQFLADVASLAKRLPHASRVANLCSDRYRFCVGFAAALLRGQVTLLPPSEAPGQLAAVLDDRQGIYALTDGEHAVPVPEFRYPTALPHSGSGEIPAFPSEQPACVLYTSGSTGLPQPHARDWGALVRAARAAGDAIGIEPLAGASVIGTVPHQHSYGLESLIMLSLQHGCVLHAERPFYPTDIRAQIAASPMPRILVTTPVHLRALLADPEPMPPLSLLLSATAPLTPELAEAAERAFAAPLHEIYGCSEIGQLAARRTTRTEIWRCLEGVVLRQEGPHVFATSPAGPETRLADIIDLLDNGDFRLLGRGTDLVNVAGKRSSLAYLATRLLGLDGVIDAVFTTTAGDQSGRLVAFAVAPGHSGAALLQALRPQIDPAFMPRRLYLVASLPRNATGKLTQDALAKLLAEADRS